MASDVYHQNASEEIEIDLLELLRLLLSRLPMLIFSAIIGALIAFMISSFVMTPQYVSSTKLYVLPRSGSDGSTVTQQELNIGTMITRDYEQLVKTREVAQTVIATLGLHNDSGNFISADRVLSMISVSATDNTRVVTIRVTNPDPYMARDLAEAVCETAAEHIRIVTNSEAVNIVDKANIPKSPSSPNVKRNVMIGALLCLVLCAAAIIIVSLANDTIMTSADIEKYLQVSVLGSIPLSRDEAKSSRPSKRKKHKKKKVSAR